MNNDAFSVATSALSHHTNYRCDNDKDAIQRLRRLSLRCRPRDHHSRPGPGMNYCIAHMCMHVHAPVSFVYASQTFLHTIKCISDITETEPILGLYHVQEIGNRSFPHLTESGVLSIGV